MNRSKKFIALISITALVLLSLLAGMVVASAGQGVPTPTQEQSQPQLDKSAGPAPQPPNAGLESGTPAVGQGGTVAVPGNGSSETGQTSPEGGDAATVGTPDSNYAEIECRDICTGEICGKKKKRDASGDVAWDGSPVKMILEGPGVYMETFTKVDGSYKFQGVPLNKTYTVREEIPPGYTCVVPRENGISDPITLTICKRIKCGVDFVNQKIPEPDVETKGSICGIKWYFDSFLQNWLPQAFIRIMLFDADDNYIKDTYTIPILGIFTFQDLDPGTYKVREEVPSGFYCIYPDNPNHEYVVVLEAGDHANYLQFKNLPYGSITGWKYEDLDQDGEYEPGSPGWAGYTIYLKQGSTTVDTATTGVDGKFEFKNLKPGTYEVVEELIPGVGSNGPLIIPNVVVGPGQNVVLSGDDQHFLNFRSPGSITGWKYEDISRDGVYQVGEPPWVGYTVYLKQGVVIKQTTTTGAGGKYEFLSVAPGTYEVEEQDPSLVPGVDSNGPLIITNVVVGPGENVVLSDPKQFFLNFYKPGSITGWKYEDLSRDGVYQAGEPPWPGYTIYLKQGSTTVDTTTTDGTGKFEFSDVEPGNYTVVEELIAGVGSNAPTTINVTVNPGEDVVLSSPNKFFLNFHVPGSIRGHKYEDKYADGLYDSLEDNPWNGVVTAVTVELWKDGAYTGKSDVIDTVDGSFLFTNVDPGTGYEVKEILSAGIFTKVSTVISGITVNPGEDVNLDTLEEWFLNYKRGSVEGWKYWDKNQNGTMDEGDEGLDGITIILTPEVGDPATTQTTSGGWFSFNDLEPGKYTISVDESTANGYYPTSVTSIDVEIASGEEKTVYFSEAPFGSISGHKWLDSNANGIWDAEEAKYVAGITIKLYQGEEATGTPLATQVTGEDGIFVFTNLSPGKYTVVEEGKQGYFSTNSDSKLIELSEGEGAVVDFGNCPYGRIEGLKVSDLNGNGAQDTNEPGLAGVEIILTGVTDPTFFAKTTTGAGGTFFFDNLKPGKYNVAETLTKGYYATRPIMVEVKVGPAESIKVMFINAPYSNIIGTKWMDDGDGVLDITKDKIYTAGMTIKLTGTTDRGETVNMVTTTGPDGSFSFLLLEAGDYTVTEVYDTNAMEAKTPASVPVTNLVPGDTARVSFLNGPIVAGEIITPPPESQQLPATGMNELPWLIAAGLLMLLGLVLVMAGYRRRLYE